MIARHDRTTGPILCIVYEREESVRFGGQPGSQYEIFPNSLPPKSKIGLFQTISDEKKKKKEALWYYQTVARINLSDIAFLWQI